MKKYIIMAVVATGLSAAIYSFASNSSNKNTCECNKTEACVCTKDNCSCSTCKKA